MFLGLVGTFVLKVNLRGLYSINYMGARLVVGLFRTKCLDSHVWVCVSAPLPAGLVPYVTAPRHFQESTAGASHLHHLRACFLLCHRLSGAALYGPASIPSVLYLADL